MHTMEDAEMECKQEQNKQTCTCTYEPCPRKGICCECIAYQALRMHSGSAFVVGLEALKCSL